MIKWRCECFDGHNIEYDPQGHSGGEVFWILLLEYFHIYHSSWDPISYAAFFKMSRDFNHSALLLDEF